MYSFFVYSEGRYNIINYNFNNMGKNSHSKITKRLKALRRRHVEEVLIRPQV